MNRIVNFQWNSIWETKTSNTYKLIRYFNYKIQGNKLNTKDQMIMTRLRIN